MSQITPAAPRNSDRGIWIALFVFSVAAFLPALGNDFVQWDDDLSVYLNPHIQGLDAHRLWWMFTNVSYVMRYRPLSWVAYALIHEVAGLAPVAYHAVQLAFHGCNVVLLYLVARRLLEIRFRPKAREEGHRIELFAALGAMVWGVHPLRVESVVWVTTPDLLPIAFFPPDLRSMLPQGARPRTFR